MMTRGTALNPANPFERFHVEEDPAAVEELRRIDPEWEPPAPKTAFFVDDTQSLITKNQSPDLSFDASLNPYRGCEHGWPSDNCRTEGQANSDNSPAPNPVVSILILIRF